MRIAVLGAGPAGLAAAWQLATRGHEVVVLEREPRVGGQSATVEVDGFRFDYGPHAYHVRRSRVDALYHEVLGRPAEPERIRQWVLLKGKRFQFPFRFYELLSRLNPLFAARVLADYAWSAVTSRIRRSPDDSFESWGVKRFGRSLYTLCFGQYTARVWGVHPSRISAALASQKLSGLSLRDIVHKLLGGSGEEQSTYWSEFYYPERGIGCLFEGLGARIEAAGGRVELGARVRRLSVVEGRVAAIEAETPDGALRVEAERVLATLPIAALARAIEPPLAPDVLEAAARLRSRALVLVNLVVDRPRAMEPHWVYLLDPTFRFNRVAEQKNLGRLCAPADRTALTFEICCERGDERWSAPDATWFELALAEAGKSGLFPPDGLSGSSVMRLAEAYPLYALGFEAHLGRVVGALGEIANLLSLGRQGLFTNCDMHDAMQMGLEAADFAERGDGPPRAWYRRFEHEWR